MQSVLSLPPFGKVLLAYQQESIRLDFPLYIFVGKNSKEEACAQKRMGTLCTFLPYGDDYATYNWPIANQRVIVVDTGFMSSIGLKKMCYGLLTYNPSVIYLHSDAMQHDLFRPTRRVSNGQ